MAKKPTPQSVNAMLNWAESVFPGSKQRILSTARVDKRLFDRTVLSGLGLFPDDLFNYSTTVTPIYEEYGATPPIMPQNNTQGGWLDKTLTTILDTTAKVIPAYTNYQLQKDAYKIQLERAKQGAEPLDLSKYGTMPVRIQHGIDPATYKQAPIAMGIDEETKNALMIGGGIIAALFLLPKLMNN